jgi:hypothetical protein
MLQKPDTNLYKNPTFCNEIISLFSAVGYWRATGSAGVRLYSTAVKDGGPPQAPPEGVGRVLAPWVTILRAVLPAAGDGLYCFARRC